MLQAFASLAAQHARAAEPTGVQSRALTPSEINETFAAAGLSAPRAAAVFVHSAGPSAVDGGSHVTTLEYTSPKTTEMHEHHEMHVNDDGTMTLVGRELLSPIAFPPAISSTSTTMPAGGVLAYVPANPRFIDGCRLAAFLAAYDQFSLEKVVFDYVQGTNLTQSGQLQMVYVNDSSDPISLETGFTALRDAYSREHGTMFSVRENSRATLGHPLLKWYYTSSDAGGTPAVEMPGYIAIFNMVTHVTPATPPDNTAVPLGTLAMSYRVRVRAPAVHAPTPTQYLVDQASMSMFAAMSIDDAVSQPVAGNQLPTAQLQPDTVYWATIAAISDGASAVSWRTWYRDAGQSPFVLSEGNLLFWRILLHNGQQYVVLFPTMSDALAAGTGLWANAWNTTAAVAADATRGFKLWNVMGSAIPN